jgi:hypothetical protein
LTLTRFHFIAVGGWLMAIILAMSVRATLGVPLFAWEGAAALGVAIAPALMILMVFRGAPPQTIAQVLYDAEHTTNPVRDRLIASVEDEL